MVMCPKCEKEIDYLDYFARVEQLGRLYKNETETDELGDWSDECYMCPECEEELFTNRDNAERFLNEMQSNN